MRRYLIIALSLMAPLAGAASAQAVVVNDGGTEYGVALIPSAREGNTIANYLASAGLSPASSSAPCADPAAGTEPDILSAGSWPLSNPVAPLCWHSGSVMHQNETFSLEWEGSAPNDYWSGTKAFVQQYLRDVASASGSLNSPYSDTTQYWDGSSLQSRAANASVFGGGCDDNGTAQCQFGTSSGSGPGSPLPSSDCTVSGKDYFSEGPGGGWITANNNLCLTDSDIRAEISRMVHNDGLIAHTDSGYTPLVVVLTPPGVEVCLDSGGTLCSANSDSGVAKAQFCSYHGVDSADGVAYVVQPWTAFTGCDEPEVPQMPQNPTPAQVSQQAGERLVSPLSQAEMASIVNPQLNGWYGLDGLEIDDQNSCQPLPANTTLDTFSISGTTYYLQREFNNAAVVDSDPYTYNGCLPNDILAPAFVVPGSVAPGDVVDFDGSSSATSLMIPNADYHWDFGDGSSATGPSVAHSYGQGGTYTVKLAVTDRGGNTSTLSQTIQVLGSNRKPVPTSPSTKSGLHVQILLMPQGFRQVLEHGVMLRVRSNEKANGVAWVSIPRSLAKRAHIRTGRGPSVVIGVGTVSGITDGTVSLHLRLSPSVVAKLRHLGRVTLTVRLSLVGTGGNRVAVDAAGRY